MKIPGSRWYGVLLVEKVCNLTERITTQLDECQRLRSVPEWLTRGRTMSVVKDKEKRGDVSNFRPITCLPVMWKLFTGVYTGVLADNL